MESRSSTLELARLLLLAGPGKGKTWTQRRIVQYHRAGGVIFDPRNEFGDIAGARWDRIVDPRFDRDNEERNAELREILDDLEPGSAAIFAEAHRWFPNKVPIESNPILDWLDGARNQGVSYVVESKRPALLNTAIPDFVQVIAWKTFRHPASRKWITDAGAFDDLPAPPLTDWYLMQESGDDVWQVLADDLARAFGSQFSLTQARPVLDS